MVILFLCTRNKQPLYNILWRPYNYKNTFNNSAQLIQLIDFVATMTVNLLDMGLNAESNVSCTYLRGKMYFLEENKLTIF